MLTVPFQGVQKLAHNSFLSQPGHAPYVSVFSSYTDLVPGSDDSAGFAA